MAAPKGLFLPEKNIADLRDEYTVLEREITEREQRRNEIKRQLDAVEIVAAMTAGKEQIEPAEEVKTNGAAHESDSPAADLVENLRKTGEALKVGQIRERLRALGHADRADQPKYVYALLFRLYKGKHPKLIKRGSKYRAAPVSSPEGETEAVGASARH